MVRILECGVRKLKETLRSILSAQIYIQNVKMSKIQIVGLKIVTISRILHSTIAIFKVIQSRYYYVVHYYTIFIYIRQDPTFQHNTKFGFSYVNNTKNK